MTATGTHSEIQAPPPAGPASQPVLGTGDVRVQVRFHQLDGLRAIAVILVLIHHVGAATLASSLTQHGHRYIGELIKTFTASGVELFFVLSGAVMLRPYFRNARQFRRVSYMQRRIERLWPPFLVAWVLSGLVVLLMTRHPTWWSKTAGLPDFSLSGWAAQLGIVYWGKGAYNFAWWSLTVEVLFYLLIPVIGTALLLTHATYRRLFFAVILAAALAVFAQNVRLDLPPWALPLRSFALYLSCFAAGIFLARYDLSPRGAMVLLTLGTAYCLGAFRYPAMNVHVGWGLVYFGLMGLALTTGPVSRWLSGWAFVWLGERSYSLFLIHYAVFTGVCYAFSLVLVSKNATYGILTRALEVPLALLAAMLMFHWVERRFARNLVTADHFWPIKRRP